MPYTPPDNQDPEFRCSLEKKKRKHLESIRKSAEIAARWSGDARRTSGVADRLITKKDSMNELDSLRAQVTRLEQERDALAAALSQLSWQPIATAPKYVGVLLLDAECCVAIGMFDKVSVNGKEYEDWCLSGQNGTNLGRLHLTHWMPLPTAKMPAVDPNAILAERDARKRKEWAAEAAMYREALEKQPCRCSHLLECPWCGGSVVEGHDQYEGSWICGSCVTTVKLPRDRTCPCGRCIALSTPALDLLARHDAEVLERSTGLKMYVWSVAPSWIAVAHARSIKEARELLAAHMGTGDGSCVVREKARTYVQTQAPDIWMGPNAEFELTDSAELEEQEAYSRSLLTRAEKAEAEAASMTCTYCGAVIKRAGYSADEFDAAWRKHMLYCDKRPEARLLNALCYIADKYNVPDDAEPEVMQDAGKWLAERDARVRRETLEGVLIGGNHLASILIGRLGAGDRFPQRTATYDEARAVIADDESYEIWCCWKSIMEARDAQEPKP